jgi:hypothetical protein
VVKVFVEGGSDTEFGRAKCREAFTRLLEKDVRLKGRLPRIVACGPRNKAFDQFRTLVRHDEPRQLGILLVDSEGPVVDSAWVHLRKRDTWNKPVGAGEDQAHLMVQCMETWILADPANLAKYFDNGFSRKKLPSTPNLEQVARHAVFAALKASTRNSKSKGEYQKSRDSFELLGGLNPEKLQAACPSARRFFDVLNKKCGQPRGK